MSVAWETFEGVVAPLFSPLLQDRKLFSTARCTGPLQALAPQEAARVRSRARALRL